MKNNKLASSRSVGMRDINALPTPISRIKTLRDDERRRGFTLIELLVVVLIIGILAAVAVPQYQKAVEKARAVEALTHVTNISKAIDAWILTQGGGPADYTELVGCGDEGKCGLLDIDIENLLMCDQAGGNQCRSRNFDYDAYCFQTNCFIYADRRQNGDMENKELQYELELRRDVSAKWVKTCYDNDNFPYSKTICQSLAAQGWVY